MKFNFNSIEPRILDDYASQFTEEAYTKIDCLTCANCCKTTVTVFNQEDIKKASKLIGLSTKQFIRKYLIRDGEEYITISVPCPFLLQDNKCQIYESRPFACQSYPHTQRRDFKKRIHAHNANFNICPITKFVLEKIEERISEENNFKSNRR
jgi:hypothetical protein